MATKIDLEAFEKETSDTCEAVKKLAQRKRLPGVAALTREQRALLPTPREDFPLLVPTLHQILKQTGLVLPTHDLAEMDQSLAIAAMLEPVMNELQAALGSMHHAVKDTFDRERANAYRIFLAYYAALVPVAAANGDVQAQYEALVELFKKKPKKPKDASNSDNEAPVVKTPVVDKVG